MTNEPYSAAEQACSLYRCFDDHGELIYVGITTAGHSRLVKHSHQARWWADVVRIDVEHHPDIEAARTAEREAISTEQPLRNRQQADYARCSECNRHLDWCWLGETPDGRWGQWYCDGCDDYDPYTASPKSITVVPIPHDDEFSRMARAMIREAYRPRSTATEVAQ